jgi:hypothetical protein
MVLLGALEGAHPVDEWTVGDLHVWPIARTRLAHRLARTMDGRPTRPRLGGATDLARRAGGAARCATTGARTPRPPAGTGDPHVVVCGDGISFSAGPTPVDRHADPFQRALRDHGVASTLLEPGHRVPAGLLGPVVRVQPALDLRAVRTRFGRLPATRLPGHDDVVRDLADRGLPDALADERTLALAGAVVSAMAVPFEAWLDRQQATAGAVVEFYALHGFAFVVACRRAGIPVIDLQHGVQGRLHYAYAGWERVPPGGYALLPDRFWVWSDDEAQAIAEWAPEGAGRCLVGGNLELQSWRTDRGRVGRRADGTGGADVTSPLRADDDPFVLVALADEESDRDLERLLDAIAAAPASWRWGLRCHPADPDVPRWERAAAARGPARVEVRASTELPLFALLDRADVLVTRASSVVIDAAAVGVPCVIVDPIGAELYAEEVAAGRARVARDGAVVAAVADAVAEGRRPGIVGVSPEPALRAVAELAGCAP